MYSNYQPNNLRSVGSRVDMQNLYSDNILAMNKGKMAAFYLSFKNSVEWKDTIFKGVIQNVLKDCTLIKDSTTGKDILFWNQDIDYVIFDEGNNS